MLIADKVQNFKDYLKYQNRDKIHDEYFVQWLSALCAKEKDWLDMIKIIDIAD